MNIARKHFEQTLAAKASEGASDSLSPSDALQFRSADGLGGITPILNDNQSDLMMAKLTSDRARLKTIQSTEAKIAAKKEILPEYKDWIVMILDNSDAIAADSSQDLLTTIMMWRVDVGQISAALDIADLVLPKNIAMPAWMNRNAATFLADEISATVFTAITSKAEFDVDIITRLQIAIDNKDMPDEAKAKVYKAEAVLLERQIDAILDQGAAPDGPAGALPSLIQSAQSAAVRAFELNEKSGVKKLIDKLARLAKKQEEAENKAK